MAAAAAATGAAVVTVAVTEAVISRSTCCAANQLDRDDRAHRWTPARAGEAASDGTEATSAAAGPWLKSAKGRHFTFTVTPGSEFSRGRRSDAVCSEGWQSSERCPQAVCTQPQRNPQAQLPSAVLDPGRRLVGAAPIVKRRAAVAEECCRHRRLTIHPEL